MNIGDKREIKLTDVATDDVGGRREQNMCIKNFTQMWHSSGLSLSGVRSGINVGLPTVLVCPRVRDFLERETSCIKTGKVPGKPEWVGHHNLIWTDKDWLVTVASWHEHWVTFWDNQSLGSEQSRCAKVVPVREPLTGAGKWWFLRLHGSCHSNPSPTLGTHGSNVSSRERGGWG